MPKKPKAKSGRGDVLRYAVLVAAGVLACIWMWATQPASEKAAVVYIGLAAVALGGYGVFRLVFRK